MFVNRRLIIEESKIENWIVDTRNKIRNFLETDNRFKLQDLFVDITYEDDCWNEETNDLWHEINITITNFSVTIELGGKVKGQTMFAMSNLQFTTDSCMPQLICENGEFKFYHVFDLGSMTITDATTFKNHNSNERFEDIITNEVLGM